MLDRADEPLYTVGESARYSMFPPAPSTTGLTDTPIASRGGEAMDHRFSPRWPAPVGVGRSFRSSGWPRGTS